MVTALFLIVAAYVIGGLPFGVWVAAAKGIDIRKMGSGSTAPPMSTAASAKKKAFSL